MALQIWWNTMETTSSLPPILLYIKVKANVLLQVEFGEFHIASWETGWLQVGLPSVLGAL